MGPFGPQAVRFLQRLQVLLHPRQGVSDIGIDVVPDDCYSHRKYLRLPWLSAGATEQFSIALPLAKGNHRILVAVDPVGDIIEPESDRANNRAWLDCVIQ